MTALVSRSESEHYGRFDENFKTTATIYTDLNKISFLFVLPQ